MTHPCWYYTFICNLSYCYQSIWTNDN